MTAGNKLFAAHAVYASGPEGIYWGTTCGNVCKGRACICVREVSICIDCSCTDGRLFMQDIPSIIKTCKAPGPLYLSSLSNEELQLLDNMMNRLYKIAEVAAQVIVALS